MLRAQLAGDGPSAGVEVLDAETLLEQVRRWMVEEGPWWGLSFTFHLLLLSSLLLFGSRAVMPRAGDELVLSSADAEPPDALADNAAPPLDLTPLKMPPVDELARNSPTELDVKVPPKALDMGSTWDDPRLPAAPDGRPAGPGGGDPNARELLGTLLAFSGPGDGPRQKGLFVGRDLAKTNGPFFGPGGQGPGGFGRRQLVVGPDMPKSQLTAIHYALHWLARHQSPEGNWSLQRYPARCHDGTCSGPGAVEAESAATAFGVLPFLAAGQTHRDRGVYQKTVAAGIGWFLRHQKADGDLRCGSTMYAHGLATIALCEAYAMTGDRAVGYAAQRAIDFIQHAQNAKTGGWRYQPGDEGDLSVVGWQIMALKSAQMAGLVVDAAVLQRAMAFLQTVGVPGLGASTGSAGEGGLFTYMPGQPPGTTMTSVGLLCHQYLGMRRDDPLMATGTAHLLRHLPDNAARDLYYWYYASQVMHNQPGRDWDAWKRKMRSALIESQEHQGCAAGSWDPQRPATDLWGIRGGRVMTTSLATLTLEVPYRYLPLYKSNAKDAGDAEGDGGGKIEN